MANATLRYHFWAGLEAQRLIVGFLGMGVLLVPFFLFRAKTLRSKDAKGVHHFILFHPP
jgi:hypothetical protein